MVNFGVVGKYERSPKADFVSRHTADVLSPPKHLTHALSHQSSINRDNEGPIPASWKGLHSSLNRNPMESA